MDAETEKAYWHIRNGGAGFYEQQSGLIAVWGKEAVQFLDGMITNDVKTLEDGKQMLAAFPNAQGRLLAVVRVLRQGERFLIETEEATREKVYQNLFRFTFAGDFFVEDLTENFRYFEMFGDCDRASLLMSGSFTEKPNMFEGRSIGIFTPAASADVFRNGLRELEGVRIDDELYETLRIESGVPRYGVDMDENTIVPELGLDGLISYSKGCYIGQEIIARIHFRGHVAKQLTGLASESPPVRDGLKPGAELTAAEGKNAGRVTSMTFSPSLGSTIALAFVRYDYLRAGTELYADDAPARVTELPFIRLS